MDTVIPKVYIPRGVFDNTGDDIYQWLTKYNNHEHIRATIPDFRFYDIRIGDEVYIYDEVGEEIFYDEGAAVVDYISGSEIRVTRSASKTLENTLLFYKAPRADVDNKILFGVNTTEDSQIISFGIPIQNEEFQQREGFGFPGFISQLQLRALAAASHIEHLSISPTRLLYPLLPFTHLPFWLVDVYSYNEYTEDITGRIIYYNEDEDGHDFLDTSTWTEYLPNTVFTEGLRKHISIIPTNVLMEEVGVYPVDKPVKPIPKGSFVALELAAAVPTQTILHLTLLFNKLV
jgi:hypothetical protein